VKKVDLLGMDNKGQLSIEGIISATIAVIIYIIVASYVFLPIYNVMSPQLNNVAGGYGAIASSLILVGIYIIMPLLLIVTMVQYVRPRVEIQQ
jgi:uncharacterized protein (UPF0333 family)